MVTIQLLKNMILLALSLELIASVEVVPGIETIGFLGGLRDIARVLRADVQI